MILHASGFSRQVTVRTVQEWARDFLQAPTLAEKCDPGVPPLIGEDAAIAQNLRPLRPEGLDVTLEQPEPFTLSTLKEERARLRLMHKFWHHELQAAELMAWAILRYPQTPLAFKQGLIRILLDEVRHMGLYQSYLERRGCFVGAFPVRDFLWQRVDNCDTPLAFVALFGMGMEAVNLEHSARFYERLLAAGDEEGAEIQRKIGCEEIAHVRFATHWFRKWTGGLEFARYRAELPSDLPPQAVRGKRLELAARRRAGMSEEFLTELAVWGNK